MNRREMLTGAAAATAATLLPKATVAAAVAEPIQIIFGGRVVSCVARQGLACDFSWIAITWEVVR